ncbi:MAG: hypothetical protein GY737_20835 [Desulfobacteraceae bacterium]|nr:hypothetical protein [Desulfobacteraceae bacterium]
MNKILSVVAALALFAGFTKNLPAAEAGWLDTYITALEEGKAAQLPQGQAGEEGLAYTPPEEIVLQEAVSKAMEQNAPVCECMKIAIDLEYNPYSVLKTIYASGGVVKLDQLCMCATEAGVMKAIVAKAAGDALSPTGTPLFHRDEIAQSQCLGGEEGLAYTASDVPLKTIDTDSNKNRNYASTTTF